MNTKRLFKSSVLLFAMFSLILTGCKKDDTKVDPPVSDGISNAQMSTLFYFSGNWCGPCGEYGKPAKDALLARANGRPVVISCQLDQSASVKDPLTNADGVALAQVFGVTGVPTMYIMGKNVGYAVGGSSNMQATAESKIDSLNALKADVGIKSTPNISGTILTLNSKIKFFNDVADAHQVAVYFIENDISGSQYATSSGWNYAVKHQGILRGKLSSSVTGDVLVTSAKAGDIKDHVITGSISASWNIDNLYAAVVVWKKVGNTVSVANCNIVKVK